MPALFDPRCGEALSKPGFEGAKFVCSPALRETRHHDELWRALHKGWLQTVGSDHCSFNYKGQKDMGKGDFTKIPDGAPGMENRLAILYTYGVLTGKLPLTRLIDVFATAPAKFFGCYPRKGSITVGADADLVIFDPAYECKISVKTSLQGIDYNAFEGFKQQGRAEQVFLRGQLIVDKGRFIGKAGQGKFIKNGNLTVSPMKACKKDRAQERVSLTWQPATGSKRALIATGSFGRAAKSRIDGYELLDRHRGVTRPTGSEGDKKIRDLPVDLMKEAGLTVRIDRIGNIFGRKDGSRRDDGTILCGSHLDSVVNGGMFDGTIGVFGAIEAV